MNKKLSIIISVAFFIGLSIIFFRQPNETPNANEDSQVSNVEIRDGIQYVSITAFGGYSPRKSTAQANIPTKLVMKTNGTYDCSAALVIKSIGYQKILPQTGEEIIDLNTPQAGTLQGSCSMGMYNFSVNFQ